MWELHLYKLGRVYRPVLPMVGMFERLVYHLSQVNTDVTFPL